MMSVLAFPPHAPEPSDPKPERRRCPSAPRNIGNSRGLRRFRRAVVCEVRLAGIGGESPRFEGRAVAVGRCRLRRWPGMGKRASIDRPAIGYREHTHLAADGGNRADRCDNGPPGRALPPVRAPVRKIARGFYCSRNCANDRSGLMGDVRRADVFVRPALPDGSLGGNAMDKVEDSQFPARAAASVLSLGLRARRGRIFSAEGLTRGGDALGIISRSAPLGSAFRP